MEIAEQNDVASCTSTYHELTLCIVSPKSISRFCADNVQYRCSTINTLQFNYLPFEAAEQKFIPKCTTTYHVLPVCKDSPTSIAGFEKSCSDHVPYRCNSNTTLKCHNLPFEAAEQNFISLWTTNSHFHQIPLQGIGGVALTKIWTDRRTDRRTNDKLIPIHHLKLRFPGGEGEGKINKLLQNLSKIEMMMQKSLLFKNTCNCQFLTNYF